MKTNLVFLRHNLFCRIASRSLFFFVFMWRTKQNKAKRVSVYLSWSEKRNWLCFPFISSMKLDVLLLLHLLLQAHLLRLQLGSNDSKFVPKFVLCFVILDWCQNNSKVLNASVKNINQRIIRIINWSLNWVLFNCSPLQFDSQSYNTNLSYYIKN